MEVACLGLQLLKEVQLHHIPRPLSHRDSLGLTPLTDFQFHLLEWPLHQRLSSRQLKKVRVILHNDLVDLLHSQEQVAILVLEIAVQVTVALAAEPHLILAAA